MPVAVHPRAAVQEACTAARDVLSETSQRIQQARKRPYPPILIPLLEDELVLVRDIVINLEQMGVIETGQALDWCEELTPQGIIHLYHANNTHTTTR